MDNDILVAEEYFKSIGIKYKEIIPPIDSDVYCIKNSSNQWGAFKIGCSVPVVDFGKYAYMEGYDSGYCLVSILDPSCPDLSNRGIIDCNGNEVIKPYTFTAILSFYGKKEPFICVFTKERTFKLSKEKLLLPIYHS